LRRRGILGKDRRAHNVAYDENYCGDQEAARHSTVERRSDEKLAVQLFTTEAQRHRGF
jgi:hypothetical protein